MRNIEFLYCFFNRLNTFIRVINDVLSPSQKVFTAYTDKIGYNIFGQTIAVYIMNSIFNSSISESMTWEEINNVVSENETVINGNRFPK